MAHHLHPMRLRGPLRLPGAASGPGQARVHGRPARAAHDARMPGVHALGVIRDRVMVKHSPTAPAVPFAGGRVWLLRLRDGLKVWEGWSDAQGWYHASGLEAGVAYVPVGIDPSGQHQATAAGPVQAVQAQEEGA